MIAVDTSAIIAIMREEADGSALLHRLGEDSQPQMSAATLFEASTVLRGLDKRTPRMVDAALDEFLAASGISVAPVTRDLADIARIAHAKYGKGQGHPAQLNFGDCFSYALAKSLNVPLLYKGADFAHTDIVSAL